MSRAPARFALAALSGILVAFSFPDMSLGWLAFVALVPLILASSWAASNREAFLLGWISTSVTWLVNVPWVIPVMSKHGGLPYPVGVSIYVAMAIYLGVYGAVFSWLVYRLDVRKGSLAVWISIPAAWISIELARTWLLSGFPWHLICEALIDLPELAMPTRWIGPYGIGFLTVLVAALVARSVVGFIDGKPATPYLFVTLLLMGAWFGVGRAMFVSAKLSLEDEKKLTVSVVQPDIEQEARWDPDKTIEIFNGLVDQTEEAADRGASLIVWPESTLPSIYEESVVWRGFIEETTRRTGADVILGSVARTEGGAGDRYTNSALLVRSGATAGRYDKIRLVPFGEYVPMKKALFFAEKLVRAVGDFEFGTNPDPLVGHAAYGLAICYEVVYPAISRESVRRGAEVLVTVTNDAWFDVSAAPYQHLAMARMRAIETDRWLVRSATTGISAIVDPTGEIVASIPLGERGLIVREVGVRATETPYVKSGDWVAWLCVIGALIAITFRWKARRA